MAGKLDLFGIGDLNVDYIVGRTSRRTLESTAPDAFRRLRSHFTSGRDGIASDDQIVEMLEMSRGFNVACLGGSAFNVVQAAAGLDRNLRLGCLGILASRQNPDADFAAWLDRHDVDRTFVLPVPGEQGSCVSLFESGRRLLRPHPATNAAFAGLFGGLGQSVAEYVSESRIVHLTPLIDQRGADLVVEWMHAIKARNPEILLSFDPGDRWSESLSPALAGIYRLVDVLFLNETELTRLGASAREQPLKPIVEDLLNREVIDASVTVAVKADRRSHVYVCDGGAVNESVHPIKDFLSEPQIEDTTGAGDVFAAGFLVGRYVHGLTLQASVDLAHRLMWRKLQGIGVTMSHDFAQDLLNAGGISS